MPRQQGPDFCSVSPKPPHSSWPFRPFSWRPMHAQFVAISRFDLPPTYSPTRHRPLFQRCRRRRLGAMVCFIITNKAQSLLCHSCGTEAVLAPNSTHFAAFSPIFHQHSATEGSRRKHCIFHVWISFVWQPEILQIVWLLLNCVKYEKPRENL